MSGSYPLLKAAILQRERHGAALAMSGGFHSGPDEESTGQMWMVGTSLWYKNGAKSDPTFSTSVQIQCEGERNDGLNSVSKGCIVFKISTMRLYLVKDA